jgi:hypothetical protein
MMSCNDSAGNRLERGKGQAMASGQPNLYADTIPPVYRTKPAELFLVTLEAAPDPESEDYGKAGGAFVNCWVDAPDLRTVELRTIALIQENRWQPRRFESWELVTQDTYADREPPTDDAPDLKRLFEQALVDGEVCVFHVWPIDAPDA